MKGDDIMAVGWFILSLLWLGFEILKDEWKHR